jgi:hypothetical protein
MAWNLEKISPSTYRISRGRERAGHVLVRDGVFNAKITVGEQAVTAQAASAGDAFRDVVAQANRILICGENDADKAAAVLARETEERNAAVKRMADDLNQIAADMGRGPVVRVRTSRRRRPLI